AESGERPGHRRVSIEQDRHVSAGIWESGNLDMWKAGYVRVLESGDTRAIATLLDRAPSRDAAVARRGARIVANVRERGDRALVAYARRFDGLAGAMEVSRDAMEAAARTDPPDVRRAIRAAARHIAHIAERQVPREWKAAPAPGVTIAQRVTPLERVGCYVPGGRYPLPSSLLMTAIPAIVAGVREVIAVCPKPDATVMAAAVEASHRIHGHGIHGVHAVRLFRVGGAHAIAALAYGTATIPRV